MATKKPMPVCRRADSPEQKDARRQAILHAAAAELARADAARDLTIETLARKLGLAKGTVYLYFPSKNALLRALLIDALESLLTDIGARLLRLASPVSSRKVAHAICEAIGKSAQVRQLPRLLKSLSEDQTKFPQPNIDARIQPFMKEADAILVRRLGKLRPGEGHRVIAYAWALHLGLSEMAENRFKKQHSCDKSLEGLPVDPEQALEEGLTLLIDGYLARSH